jgi:hypothetical protein
MSYQNGARIEIFTHPCIVEISHELFLFWYVRLWSVRAAIAIEQVRMYVDFVDGARIPMDQNASISRYSSIKEQADQISPPWLKH